MGLVYATITLSNPVKPELRSMEVKCLVDIGSTFLCIPAHIANQLELKPIETREATLADGSVMNVPYSGPIKVNFGLAGISRFDLSFTRKNHCQQTGNL